MMIRKLLVRLGMTGSILLVTVLTALSSFLLYSVLGSLLGGLATVGMAWSLLVPMMLTPPIAYALMQGSAQLDTMKQELIKINAHLESRVQARTAELVRANEELQAEVAERLRMENSLQESEARYRTVIEQTREGIVLYDASSLQVIEANPAYCTLLGYSSEEMLELTLYDIVAHDRASIDANLKRIGREGHHYTGERLHRRKDGSLVDVEVSVNLITYAGTEVMCVLVRDIAERKRAEEALRRQSERLGALRDIERAILAAQSPGATAQVALRRLGQQLELRRASVVTFDFESNTGSVLATHGYAGSQLDSGACVPLESFNLQQLSVGKVRTVEDVRALHRQTATDRILYQEGIRAYANIPLFAEERLIGSLNLGWGESEPPQRAELEVAEEVAGSLAVALQQARLREQLQHHALELETQAQQLARSNAFITALSEAAIRLQTVSDPQHVMETLGTELRSLGMTCMICLMEPDGQALVIRYSSMQSTVMKGGEKLLGASMIGYRMPQERFRVWPEIIEERRAVLMPDVVSLMEPLLPGILKSTIRQVLRLGGLRPDVRVIWLPLVVGKRAIGGMAVWGKDLLERDVLPLTIFAGQVAIALENSHLYVAERQRVQELARTSEQLQKELGERQRAEETLQHYAAELERSNQELQQFAYVASHDLQEPLRMVTSYLQLLEQRYKGQLDADADTFIHFAVDGAARMHELIKGLLVYSRIGTQGQSFQPTDTETIFRQVLDNLRLSIEESGGTIIHDNRLPTVAADPTQLTQLFQNLVSNALKFRRDVPLEIHIGAERRGGDSRDGSADWLFYVQDNGIGIASRYVERIFVIFQRLHTREAYPGTGIGLAVCKRIVERHGGHIWVESEPDKGSTFYFTIPERR